MGKTSLLDYERAARAQYSAESRKKNPQMLIALSIQYSAFSLWRFIATALKGRGFKGCGEGRNVSATVEERRFSAAYGQQFFGDFSP